ncbi:hypothetical protein F2Q68_00015008 [Brassica cretica]|uniref:Agenet domain-containing protein n=1 Tax=Brassica cretica TaxID=69181 RepID=A0A8S9HFC1_BRACR|nr:hypothetical protein F2Q68_00015008 [Brassica cretica]
MGTQAFEVMNSVLFNIKLILLIMWDFLVSTDTELMDETAFKRVEADLDQAAGTVDKETEESRVQTLLEVGENVEIASGRKWYPGNVLKTNMRNGVEMVKVEYSTLFQDKKKKTKRLQESVSSDKIRPQPPSEKPEETKSLELMDNVEAYHNDGWCSARRLASGTPINGKGVVIFKYPSDPTVTLVYLSAAFLLACIVAGLFSIDSDDYVGFACVRECFACENLLAHSRWMRRLLNAVKQILIKQLELLTKRVQTLFTVGENVEIASGRKWYPENVLKTDMRNGVEMVKVEYSTLFQDKKKKTKRLQESVSSGRIRPQPPSEKPEETKSLELMENVEDRNMMRDSIPELLALPELKHPIGSEPKPKVTINQYSTAAYIKTGPPIIKPEEFDRIRRTFMGLEPLDGSHASPLSQQIETQVYSPNSAQHIEKEQLNEAHDAHTQVFPQM